MYRVIRPKKKDYEWLYAFRKEMRDNPTKGESKMKQYLDEWGVNYSQQSPIKVNGKCYILDFKLYSKTIKKCIDVEVDGKYHKEKEQKVKDKERNTNIENGGYVVIRFSNAYLNRKDFPFKFKKKLYTIGANDLVDKIKIDGEVWKQHLAKCGTKKGNRSVKRDGKKKQKGVTRGIDEDCFWREAS